MKKTKIIIYTAVMFIILFFNTLPAHAATIDDIIEEQKQTYDLEQLEDQIPDSADKAARDLDEPLTFTEEMQRRGLDPQTRLIAAREEPAVEIVAANLQLEVGAPTVYFERLRLADGSEFRFFLIKVLMPL
jgi:hypothetical protein